jgi:two-component system, cell cycle response regulator
VRPAFFPRRRDARTARPPPRAVSCALLQGAGERMLAPENKFRDAVATLFARPDELNLELGAGGELLVARLRVVVAALLLLFPLANVAFGGSLRETMIGLVAAVLVNVFAHIWLALARQARRHPWLPFVTSAWDVTLTTIVLGMLALNHLPSGLNSLIVWCGYPLAISLAALRSDGRVALLAVALALVQYAGMVAAVFLVADSPEHLMSSEYGTVTLGGQLQRLLLIVAFGMVTLVVVHRMQRLVELSGTDGLTGLPNRSWLLHRMPRLLDEVRDDAGSLTLALVDLDRFRFINEEAGHQAGDRALRHFVSMLREELAHDEWAVRIGGQEFVLLLRQPLGTAWEHVDAMRRSLAERGFVPQHGAGRLPLTISAGLANFPAEAADLSGLLRRADRRLKRAKREGRNRVVARDD